MHPSLSSLPSSVQDTLLNLVKPKFDAYFAFTSKNHGSVRSIPDPGGQPWFVYPDDTMIADLIFLWSAFSDVYQVVGGPTALAKLIQGDAILLSDFQRIVEGHTPSAGDGSFWHFPTGRVVLQDALASELPEVLRTLRNGFAHSHWFYTNVSALDYWRQLGWDTTNADKNFDIGARAATNYMMYIADAREKTWKPHDFWAMNDLRIVVTAAGILRYHLHLFLNCLLNGSRDNVFNH